MSRARRLPAVAAPVLLAACTVGPTYRAPDLPLPAAYAGPVATAPAGTPADGAGWWTRFGDAELTSLVARALADGPDVRLAGVRIREARLREAIARSAGKPVVNASADANHIHFSRNAGFSSIASLFGGGASGGSAPGGLALPGSGITTYAVGFDASWEIDVFGGVRRGVEAARAQTDAAIWTARDAQVMIAAEVAQAYWALRLDQARIGIVEDEIAHQTRALAIADHSAQVGLVPAVDVARQRQQITANQARLAPLRADADRRVDALAVLVGRPPGTIAGELAAATATPPGAVFAVPAGLPSDLLRRRPDIRAAERTLAAATAEIGVAVADLYPRFSLTGMAQLISTALGTLFQGDSAQLTATGAARFPLLDWGRRRATVRVREAQRDAAYEQYRATVLGALRDVEDALAQLAAERQRCAALARAVADAEVSVHATDAQYRTGFVAQDRLLDGQTQLLQAREQLAESDAALRQMSIALVKALGGGWSEGVPPAS